MTAKTFVVLYLFYYGMWLAGASSYTDAASEEVVLHRMERAGPTDVPAATEPYTIYPSQNLPATEPIASSAIYIITSFIDGDSTVPTSSFPSPTPIFPNSSMTTTSTTSTSARTTTSQTTTTSPPYNPDVCTSPNEMKLVNGTCVDRVIAQSIAANSLRNNSTSTVDRANGLSLYISSFSNATNLQNNTNVLSVSELDHLVANLSGVNLTISANTSFLMVQQPVQDDNVIVLGASFKRGIGGATVNTKNRVNVTNSSLSAAAIVEPSSLTGVTSLKMMVIDQPTLYEHADNVTNKTLASSVIIVNLLRNNSRRDPLQLSLYWRPLEEYQRNGSGQYLCSYFDENASAWDEVGCTDAVYSSRFNRYECTCNHTTSFALIWLPRTLSATAALDARDIASLVFQSVSIICFLFVLIHATVVRILQPLLGVPAMNLLPLISTACTTILFIFYIALGMTVFTRTTAADQTVCFSSALVLMFIVYFLLIFMFAVKVIAGYFYFERFVRLFPQPSHRKLAVMLAVAVLVAAVAVGLAIGFNARYPSPITQLYPYKLCWFTRPAIYYFMLIPIGLSLLFNLIVSVLVTVKLFEYARNAPAPHLVNDRLKRCVIVLLSSCITQGIGWVLGPVISFVNPNAGVVLSWFFIVINGLEGLWTIILYVLIRSQRLDEQRHVAAAIKLAEAQHMVPDKAPYYQVRAGRRESRPSRGPTRPRDERRWRGANIGDFIAHNERF